MQIFSQIANCRAEKRDTVRFVGMRTKDTIDTFKSKLHHHCASAFKWKPLSLTHTSHEMKSKTRFYSNCEILTYIV